MSQKLQLGEYEFYPYDEKIQRLLDEILPTDDEREQRRREAKKEIEKFIKRGKRLRKINTDLI